VPPRTRRLFLAVSLLTLALYILSARALPMTFDEQIVYDTTAALAHGRPYIDPHSTSAQIVKPGRFSGLAVRRPDGKQVGIYGLGTSIVGAPLYAIGKVVAQVAPKAKRERVVMTTTMFTDALITATAVFVLMLVCLLLGAPPPGAVLVGIAYGLGSYAFPHALTLFTEPGTALAVIAAVYFAIRAARRGRTADLVWCGVCAGGALWFRVSAALFLPVFGVLLLVAAYRRRASLRRVIEVGAWYTAGALVPLLLLLVINWWRYKSATNFGYALGTATDQSYPITRGVVNQWFSLGKSVFFYAPVAVISVLGLVKSCRRMPMEIILLGSLVVVNTLFFARVQFWSGDWAWGPRYMQIVLPCLAAMAAPLMVDRAWRNALVVLSVLGFFLAALPAVLVRYTIEFYAACSATRQCTVKGPTNWDHSYYALIWHTRHWQPIGYQVRHLWDALTNSLSHVTTPLGPNPVNRFGIPAAPGKPRFEMWWLRARDLSAGAVLLLALIPLGLIGAGVRALDRSLETPSESPETSAKT